MLATLLALILLVTLFVFVSGVQLGPRPPQAVWETHIDQETDEFVVSITRGDDIDPGEIRVRAGSDRELDDYTSQERLGAGDSVSIPLSDLNVSAGDEISIVWTGGRQSFVFHRDQVSDEALRAGGGGGGDGGGGPVPLIVDDDGDAPYRTITGALQDATDGDTILVLDGTYEESVTVEKNVTIRTNESAVLDGSSVTSTKCYLGYYDCAFKVNGSAHPRFLGFVVRDYTIAVEALSTTGDWQVGGFRVDNVASAVMASSSEGDWLVNGTVARNVSNNVYDAELATGNWTLRNVVADAGGPDDPYTDASVGVYAPDSTGDWRVINATVRRNGDGGVDVSGTTGDWVIRETMVRDNGGDSSQPGIAATDTSGTWAVRNSTVRDNADYGIDATGANPVGDASQNVTFSGNADGPCTGNVTC